MLRLNAREHGDEIAFAKRISGSGASSPGMTTRRRVRDFALGLVEFGLRRDDVVGIIGDNRPDWVAARSRRTPSVR